MLKNWNQIQTVAIIHLPYHCPYCYNPNLLLLRYLLRLDNTKLLFLISTILHTSIFLHETQFLFFSFFFLIILVLIRKCMDCSTLPTPLPKQKNIGL